MEKPALDKSALRRAFGNFVTGVTIVTAIDDTQRPRGLTVNSFTSVSLDPPLVLVCVANTAQSLEVFQNCTGFAINILHEDQRLCSDLFASKSSNKFDDVEWSLGPTGAPGIAGSLAVFDCTKSNVIKAGDHIVLIGEVASFKSSAGRPLVYGQGGYISVSVQQAAVARSPGRNVVVGCVVDYEGSVFLNRTQQGKWRLPEAVQRNETTDELRTLNSALKDMGATVEITFLYSVYDIASENAVAIVYRGTLSELPEKSGHARLYAESQIPWDDIEPKESKEVLQRFFTDLRLNQFSIYSDVLDEPRVAHLQPDPPRSWDTYVSEVGSKSERPA